MADMQPTERGEVRVFVVCETLMSDGIGRVPHSVLELCGGSAPAEDDEATKIYDEDISPGSDVVIISIDLTDDNL